jgi:hypothetical protein
LPPSQNINLTQNLIYRPSLYNEHAVYTFYTLMPSALTQLDRDIIAHLQEDGRRAIVTIARETGVTEKTVRAHVNHRAHWVIPLPQWRLSVFHQPGTARPFFPLWSTLMPSTMWY